MKTKTLLDKADQHWSKMHSNKNAKMPSTVSTRDWVPMEEQVQNLHQLVGNQALQTLLKSRESQDPRLNWIENLVGPLPGIQIDQSIAAQQRLENAGGSAGAEGNRILGKHNSFQGVEGRFRLAHEVAHVLQQRSNLPRGSELQAETDANQFAQSMVRGVPAAVELSASPGLALMPDEVTVGTLAPASADDLWRLIQGMRGFGGSESKHAVEAAEEKVERLRQAIKQDPENKTLSRDLKKAERELVKVKKILVEWDPKMKGKPLGKGYSTYAAIQVLDKNGNQVAVGIGQFGDGLHAEEHAILDLEAKLKSSKVKGGRVMVVVDQHICSKCMGRIKAFASKYDISVIDRYVPSRAALMSSGKQVTPKTAATTSFVEGRGVSLDEKRIYTKPGPSIPEGGAPLPTGVKPSKGGGGHGVASKSPRAVSPSPKPSIPEKPVTRPITRKGGISVAPARGGGVKISSNRVWSFAGKAGTVASGVLGILGILATIDDAGKRIERAQTGSVGPEVAQAMRIFRSRYAEDEAAKIWEEEISFDSDEKFPAAKAWLNWNGANVLLGRDRQELDIMGDHLNTLRNYAWDLERIEDEYDKRRREIAPILPELRWRIEALSTAAQDLLDVMQYLPSDTAQSTLFGVYMTFKDAAMDIGKLESMVPLQHWTYDQGYINARKAHEEAVAIFNYWSPAFAAIWKQITGFSIRRTTLGR